MIPAGPARVSCHCQSVLARKARRSARWAVLVLLPVAVVSGATLTPEQRQWLEAHPHITVASDPTWPPFSFADAQGRLTGLDVDLLALVSRETGIAFARADVASWPDALDRARRREIDVLTGAGRTAEREKDWIFTDSYISQSLGIVTRLEHPQVSHMDELRGNRIAIPRGHAILGRLQHDRPEWTLIVTENIEEAMRLVAGGGADAAFTSLVNASYLIKTRGLTNLKIAGLAPYRFEMRFAVRRDWPELAGILNTAVASLDEAEKKHVLDRWVQVDSLHVVRWDLILRALGWGGAALAAVIAGILWHNRRLQAELAKRAAVERELRGARDRLSTLNEEKTNLINMAAHDLRNPLTGIILSLELVDTDNRDTRKRIVSDLARSSQQMVRMLSELLDLQLLESGRRSFQLETVTAPAAALDAARAAEAAAGHKRIAIHCDPGEPRAAVQADRSALQQVLDNLLSNAIKYSPPGSRVWVYVRGGETHVRFSVRDEGPGIAAEELPLLFTKYARLSPRPTGGERSTGLGLSIARQLVEGMAGRIWCESELGRGAAFHVELPLAADPALAAAR